MISWCLNRGKHTRSGCTGDVNIVPYFGGIWMDHVPLCTHIYLFLLLQSSVREADVLLTGKKKKSFAVKKKKNRGEEVEGKIYEYANLVTVWNLVMSGKCCRHLSLCRGHCLMPGSWAQLLLLPAPPPSSTNLSCHLTETWTKLRPGTKQNRGHGHTQKTPAYCCCGRKTQSFYFCGLTSKIKRFLRHFLDT